MKKILITVVLISSVCSLQAQKQIRDESLANQQERMVFKQWDRSRFTPTSGFLGLNPYYWLTWGLHPNYPKSDLRPLALLGPQTQRLSAVGGMQRTDKNYELESDSLRQTALAQFTGISGLLSATDPLWVIYYSRQFKELLDFDRERMLSALPLGARRKLLASGSVDWYTGELGILAERLEAARTVTLDRGARIMSYHRLLLEYKKMQAFWADKVIAAGRDAERSKVRSVLKGQEIKIESWTPDSDVGIAKEILRKRKY